MFVAVQYQYIVHGHPSVTATDCTSSCGTITSQTKTITEANGGTCTTAAPTYSCQPGDGSCPLPINCAWASVTATDCTPSCGIITSQTKTITEANGGTCTTAAPTYSCQPGDGSCFTDNDSEVYLCTDGTNPDALGCCYNDYGCGPWLPGDNFATEACMNFHPRAQIGLTIPLQR